MADLLFVIASDVKPKPAVCVTILTVKISELTPTVERKKLLSSGLCFWLNLALIGLSYGPAKLLARVGPGNRPISRDRISPWRAARLTIFSPEYIVISSSKSNWR
jgi:hypothetical protein